MVYEPREDSFLLRKAVVRHATGNVLDMGTGTGILAAAAEESSKVCSVTAVDIDPEALAYCTKKHPSLTVIQSNLFAAVTRMFDTIIFNPPYLPDDPSHPDPALDGGTHGWELIERFFAEAPAHLAEGGFILLLFSSHTGKENVDQIIWQAGFFFDEIGREKLDFEELFVYRCHR